MLWPPFTKLDVWELWDFKLGRWLLLFFFVHQGDFSRQLLIFQNGSICLPLIYFHKIVIIDRIRTIKYLFRRLVHTWFFRNWYFVRSKLLQFHLPCLYFIVQFDAIHIEFLLGAYVRHEEASDSGVFFFAFGVLLLRAGWLTNLRLEVVLLLDWWAHLMGSLVGAGFSWLHGGVFLDGGHVQVVLSRGSFVLWLEIHLMRIYIINKINICFNMIR